MPINRSSLFPTLYSCEKGTKSTVQEDQSSSGGCTRVQDIKRTKGEGGSYSDQATREDDKDDALKIRTLSVSMAPFSLYPSFSLSLANCN